MAISKTTYLELNKPDYDAIADIEVLNENSDIIDEMFDGTHLVQSVNGVTPTGGAVAIDLGVTSVNGQTGAVTITERSVKQLIDIIYPVGSYYETTNASFNPNTAWAGTTWQRITDGRVLIAGGGDYTVGTNYGEKTHKITTSEMPVHNHTASSANNGLHNHGGNTGSAGAHKHDRGNMNITGSITNPASDNDLLFYTEGATGSGALSISNSGTSSKGPQPGGGSELGKNTLSFNAKNGWTGETSKADPHTHKITSDGTHNHTITVNNSGSGTPMNIVQPSAAVARWLRTA